MATYSRGKQKRPTIRANVPPIFQLREANNDSFDRLFSASSTKQPIRSVFLSSESESSASGIQQDSQSSSVEGSPLVFHFYPKPPKVSQHRHTPTSSLRTFRKINQGRVHKRTKKREEIDFPNFRLLPAKRKAMINFDPPVQSTPVPSTAKPENQQSPCLTDLSPVTRFSLQAQSPSDSLLSKFVKMNIGSARLSSNTGQQETSDHSISDRSTSRFEGFKSPAVQPFQWEVTMCKKCNGALFRNARDLCKCFGNCSGDASSVETTKAIEENRSAVSDKVFTPNSTPDGRSFVNSRRNKLGFFLRSNIQPSLSDGTNDSSQSDTDEEDRNEDSTNDGSVLYNSFEPGSLDTLDENAEDQCEESDSFKSASSPKRSPVEGAETPTNRTPTMRRKSVRNSEERSPTGRSSGLGRASIIPDLIKVDEEPEINDENDAVMALQNLYLMPGKMYRRSLAIVRSFDTNETSIYRPAEKGSNYERTVEEVLKLQKNVRLSAIGDGEGDVSQILRQSINERRRQMSLSLSRRRSAVPRSSEFCQDRSAIYRRISVVLNQKDSSIGGSQFLPSCRPSGAVQDLVRTPVHSFLHPGDCSRDSPLNDTTVQYDDNSEKISAETLILRICGLERPCYFEDVLNDDCYANGRKLGEGVFGEVFLITRGERQTVLKVIPIEGDFNVNEAPQKTYEEVLSEVFIAKSLHELSYGTIDNHYKTDGFAEIVDIQVVQGRYPEKLLEFWNTHNRDKGSMNDNPSVFKDDQLFILMEQGNGGTALEDYCFTTARSALSIFVQVTFALAAAECELEFEHRDLHWGNILVGRTTQKTVCYRLKGVDYHIPTHGVKGTIIDFTLSRMTYESRIALYNDIGRDPDMFIGHGDYQFEVYRQMKKDVGNEWSKFAPKTNARWLFYTIDKLLTKAKYLRRKAKIHLSSIAKMEKIRSWIEECESAFVVAQELANELNF
ncbi:Domain of unknown function (DUF3635) [Nesidiocoris tenuis]|uniref:non-specific serine/threonine protein kinase n=1 Tax=Nesidiocoris tenuis TaxID=355587 RepID=A0ABN7AIH5_9HEMI|nr:Domain of unknown function (DUF3635) [Nesidiocoris tenuis]